MGFQFKPDGGNFKYLFPKEGEPLTVQLLEDLGQVEAIGPTAKDQHGNQKYMEAFKVRWEGKEKILAGGWRLRAALKVTLKESPDPQPMVTIRTTYKTEKLKTGQVVAVKHYTIEELASF